MNLEKIDINEGVFLGFLFYPEWRSVVFVMIQAWCLASEPGLGAGLGVGKSA